MLPTSEWLRRGIVVAALAVASAFALVSHSVASPAAFPHDEAAGVEAQNGDWPW